jgi:hypothetical protein
MLSNPNLLTNTVIDAMEASDTSGNLTINDPNNGFVIQMMANNHIFSKFAELVDYTNAFYYSRRARNSEQLYTHLSEFDYINLMAKPAVVPFVFAMSKQWIVANAVLFDANYNKIQIPATSFITMGGLTYSMYHPIDIFVNRNTGSVTAFYNTEKTNSLYSLESNMLLDVQEYTRDGIEFFQVIFNTFQFNRSVKDITASVEQGFIRTFAFEDQFYAAKVFYYASDNTWTELSYSLSQMVYDYKTPTALITVMNDSNEVKIEIPQIYFSNNQISQSIRVELYTTRGAINISLSAADVTGVVANFDTVSSEFAAPLAQMPTWLIVPTSLEVVGGSDSKDYDEIRDAIVNQRLHSQVPITSQQLTQAAVNAGFEKITRYIDDVTERMYFVSNVLTDSDDMILPTFTGDILITDTSLEGGTSSIINYSDGYNTILPTTLFKITNDTTTCLPLTDGETSVLQAMSKADQIIELNRGNLVRQPFHITLLTDAKSPYANVYNLLSPKMKSLTFIRENPGSAPQMSVIACSVEHQDNGTGGFRVLMTVDKSSNIENADRTNFKVVLTCKTKIGEDVYIPATYVGVDNNNNDVWQVILATNYHITTEDFLTVMMLDAANTLSAVELSLEQTFNILTMFVSTFDSEVPNDLILNNQLPSLYVGTHTAMAQQKMVLSLGKNLSNQVYCGVNTTWGNDVYDTADSTVYYTTNVPVFQTNESGVIVTRKNTTTNAIEVVKVYDIGDIPSATGDIIYSTNQDALATTTILHFTSTVGVLVGMDVRGLNVPINAKVLHKTNTTVTLNIPIVTTITNKTEITFTNPNMVMRVFLDQIAEGPQLVVEDTNDILVGQSVFGFGIPNGSKVISIDSDTEFTIDNDTTEIVTENTVLTFLNTTAPGVVKIAQGDVLKDPTGKPIIIKGASNQYAVPSILFDSRLFVSDQPSDQAIVETITQRMQSYADQIANIDSSFIEDADVFYKPVRTMGMATFGIGNNQKIRLPLSLSFSVTIYLDPATYSSDTTKEAMEATVISTINEEIRSSIISVSEISGVIRDRLGATNASVEMGGINGNDSLRLIALEDSTGVAGIEYTLILLSDNTIDRVPNVKITFLPKPDTSV